MQSPSVIPSGTDPGRAVTALADVRRLFETLDTEAHALDNLARWTADLILGGARLLVCGNGGSAAEAQHFATELVGRYCAERRSLPALALTADGALLTCIGNDYGADAVFARQVQGLGRAGDLLVGLSTSGNSRNVLAAIDTARQSGLHTLALLGKGGGPIAGNAERQWIVPSQNTARIQEAHLWFIHVVCDYIDAALT